MASSRTRHDRNDRRVARFMTPNPHTIGSDQTLRTAHALMRRHRIRHLPVLEEGRLVGVVSMDDLHLVETLRDVRDDDTLVEEAMTEAPYVVEADTPIEEVAREMAERRIGSAVVLTNDRVAGIFTATDALRALASSEDFAAHHQH